MKHSIITSIILVLSFAAFSQTESSKFDRKLADSLGADQYGMKKYILVILKSGPNQISDKKILDSLFKGHMDNIKKLAAAGKLIVAGPLGKNEKSYRGIFILNVKTPEEATALLESDPAVKEGILAAESFTWYGSAALPMYLPFHKVIEEINM